MKYCQRQRRTRGCLLGSSSDEEEELLLTAAIAVEKFSGEPVKPSSVNESTAESPSRVSVVLTGLKIREVRLCAEGRLLVSSSVSLSVWLSESLLVSLPGSDKPAISKNLEGGGGEGDCDVEERENFRLRLRERYFGDGLIVDATL